MNKTQRGLFIWLIATLFVIYGFCLNTVAAVFADDIKSSLQITDIGISIGIGSFIVGYAFMQIPAGYLLDRFSTRFLLSSAVLLVTIGNILISHAHNLALFSFANFLQGIGSSFAFIAVGLLTIEWFSVAMFPILIGLIETLSTIIAGSMHYIFVMGFEGLPWESIYKASSICGIILFLLTILFVKLPENHAQKKPISFKKSLKKVINNKQVWLCTIAAATSFGILLAYADFWYVRVQKYYLVEKIDTALIGTMFSLGIALGTPILGWLSNVVKSHKLILHISLVIGNMMLLLALYTPHLAIKTLIIIKIISFLTGFFLSGAMLFYTVAKEAVPEETQGVALGIANTGVFLFNSVMLLIPYVFVTSISKEFFTYLWILPFCVMISILLNYFIQEKKFKK